MAYVPVTHKFVAVLNKKVPVSNLMNALGHVTAGLAATYPRPEELRFDDYVDADSNTHAHISDNPFIVLQADNSNQLRVLRHSLLAAGLLCVDFTSTMTQGTYAEQQERTRATPEAELDYWAVATFAEIEQLGMLTKKFSLWRG